MPRFDLYDDAIGFIAFRRTRAGAERTADAEANRCGRPVAILEHGRSRRRVNGVRRVVYVRVATRRDAGRRAVLMLL